MPKKLLDLKCPRESISEGILPDGTVVTVKNPTGIHRVYRIAMVQSWGRPPRKPKKYEVDAEPKEDADGTAQQT